jgi:anaphase-promoting complex subunit 3
MDEVLPFLIQTSLENYLYSNAIFLAERLVASYPTDAASIHLLARSHYFNSKPDIAFNLLKGTSYPPSLYLFARCCLDLNKLTEGENALMKLIDSYQHCGM